MPTTPICNNGAMAKFQRHSGKKGNRGPDAERSVRQHEDNNSTAKSKYVGAGSNWLRRDFFDNVFDNSDSCPCPCSYSNTDANTNSDSDADTNSDTGTDTNSNSNSHSHPNSDDTGTMVHIAVHDADKPHPRRPSQYRQGAGDRGVWQ